MGSIIHVFDQPNKKDFDDRSIYLELEKAVRDRTSNDFYEYIGFLLAENLSDRRPWGDCLVTGVLWICQAGGLLNILPLMSLLLKWLLTGKKE